VAVGTQHAEVREPVVVVDSVDVIEVQRESLALPLGDAALATSVRPASFA
jgi:hypothetical protein